MILQLILLAGVLASYWYFLRGDLPSRPLVAEWLNAGTRGRFFAFWCARALVLFAGVTLVALAVQGRLAVLTRLPIEFASAGAVAVGLFGDARDLPLDWILLGLFGGGVIGGVVDALRKRGKPWMLGDISRVMPRHRGELGWGVALSLVAGVSEELYFRLLLPLLIATLTGEPLVGFGASIALFAGAHRYQGWIGVAVTGFVAVLLTTLYLMTGALWMAMLVHVVIDLNGLVLRPIMAGVLRIRSSAANPS